MLDLSGLHARAALFRCVREFFFARGFLEVDTPVRQPVLIPEQHIVPIAADGEYLQTSPELCMKRLLAAGCDNIFQICPCFRKNERGRKHLEEFVMLEWYRRNADYFQLMLDCEALLQFLALRSAKYWSSAAPAGEHEKTLLLLGKTPERLTVEQAFSRYAPMTLAAALQDDCFEHVLVEYVEPQLGLTRPVLLMEYPAELASLARISPLKPTVAERFELYACGMELANGFSELTDADEQRARFREELGLINKQPGRYMQAMPERFLEDLGKIGAAAGIALGLDRLLMLLTGKNAIDEVVSFIPGDF